MVTKVVMIWVHRRFSWHIRLWRF